MPMVSKDLELMYVCPAVLPQGSQYDSKWLKHAIFINGDGWGNDADSTTRKSLNVIRKTE